MNGQCAKELGYAQIPHFCTHAIEAFEELARLLEREVGISPDFELFLRDLLRDSVKFLLPDNGFLFENVDYRPELFDLQRLPYPICALEFVATEELYASGSGLAHAAKRIAVCFDPRQLRIEQLSRLNGLVGRDLMLELPERCLGIVSVYQVDNIWASCVGVVLIDLDGDRPVSLKGVSKDKFVVAERLTEILPNKKKTAHGLPVTLVPFPVRSAMVGHSAEHAAECLLIDTLDEVRTTYQFLAAINASNVGTQEIPAPKQLNEKRKKKGKVPFYPYKILDIGSATAEGSGGGGSHASPRTHLRRGHLRRLGERFGGKVLWINATVVNSKTESGPVSQVYKVRGAKS